MATSTLIQKLDRVTDPLVTGTVGSAVNTMDRAQTEWFLTSSAIALGDWVAFDTSKTGVDRVLFVSSAATVATGNALVCGVAQAAVTGTATAPARVLVVVGGYAAAAKCTAAVSAAGIPLIVVGTAATAELHSGGAAAFSAPPCGTSLGAVAAGLAPVWVIKQF
jgi:hypothetical protein